MTEENDYVFVEGENYVFVKGKNYVFVEEEEYVLIDEKPKVYHYPHQPKPNMNMIFLLKNIMFRKPVQPSVDLSELMRV